MPDAQQQSTTSGPPVLSSVITVLAVLLLLGGAMVLGFVLAVVLGASGNPDAGAPAPDPWVVGGASIGWAVLCVALAIGGTLRLRRRLDRTVEVALTWLAALAVAGAAFPAVMALGFTLR